VIAHAIGAAPDLAQEARDRLSDAGERIAGATKRHGAEAARTVRETPLLWAAGAALAGYALGWLVHARRD
jgi:hypothetical protein